MDVIALIVQKGGTGKTTLGLSLAVAAEQAGRTAVVIDLDPQGTACRWKERRERTRPGEGPIVIDAQPARLPAALETAAQKGVDLVIIDTPAKSEQSALAAARAADLVVIPCRPSAFDLETIDSTRDILNLAGSKPALAVLNAIPSTGDRHEQAFRHLDRLGVPTCSDTIGARVGFFDAGMMGLSITEVDPRGKGAQEILQVYKSTCALLDKLKGRKTAKRKEASHAA
jgi:chromosome partitioning protein